MGTAIIVIILLLLCVYAGYSYRKKLRYGGGCCGEHDAMETKVKVADRNKKHYSYQVILSIDGMTCSNCSRRVENALNQQEGMWAKVDLGSQKATVLLKQPPDPTTRRAIVQTAGYTVLSIQQSP